MDPVSLVGTIVSSINLVVRTGLRLHSLRGQYETADLTILSMCSVSKSVETSLYQLGRLIQRTAENNSWDTVAARPPFPDTFNSALLGIISVYKFLDQELKKLAPVPNSANDRGRRRIRLKKIWKESLMRQLLDCLNDQQIALGLVLRFLHEERLRMIGTTQVRLDTLIQSIDNRTDTVREHITVAHIPDTVYNFDDDATSEVFSLNSAAESESESVASVEVALIIRSPSHTRSITTRPVVHNRPFTLRTLSGPDTAVTDPIRALELWHEKPFDRSLFDEPSDWESHSESSTRMTPRSSQSSLTRAGSRTRTTEPRRTRRQSTPQAPTRRHRSVIKSTASVAPTQPDSNPSDFHWIYLVGAAAAVGAAYAMIYNGEDRAAANAAIAKNNKLLWNQKFSDFRRLMGAGTNSKAAELAFELWPEVDWNTWKDMCSRSGFEWTCSKIGACAFARRSDPWPGGLFCNWLALE